MLEARVGTEITTETGAMTGIISTDIIRIAVTDGQIGGAQKYIGTPATTGHILGTGATPQTGPIIRGNMNELCTTI